MGWSIHLCMQPPLLMAHSLISHLLAGSSSPSGQSFCLSHTLSSVIHWPPPQSKCVVALHIVSLWMPGNTKKKRNEKKRKKTPKNIVNSFLTFLHHFFFLFFRYLPQFNSSLLSAQSNTLLHIRWPAMQELSAHWNWSGRQVLFLQLWPASSSQPGQSHSPSHNQLRCRQVMRSLHWNSLATQGVWESVAFLQFWKMKQNFSKGFYMHRQQILLIFSQKFRNFDIVSTISNNYSYPLGSYYRSFQSFFYWLSIRV